MNNHENARLTVHGRELLVKRVLQQGLRPEEAAQAAGVSVRTVYKWLERYREEGIEGLCNRPSRPRDCPHATSREGREQIIARRRQRQTYHQISRDLGVGRGGVAASAR